MSSTGARGSRRVAGTAASRRQRGWLAPCAHGVILHARGYTAVQNCTATPKARHAGWRLTLLSRSYSALKAGGGVESLPRMACSSGSMCLHLVSFFFHLMAQQGAGEPAQASRQAALRCAALAGGHAGRHPGRQVGSRAALGRRRRAAAAAGAARRTSALRSPYSCLFLEESSWYRMPAEGSRGCGGETHGWGPGLCTQQR